MTSNLGYSSIMARWLVVAFTGHSSRRWHPGSNPVCVQVHLIFRHCQVYLKPADLTDSMSSVYESSRGFIFFEEFFIAFTFLMTKGLQGGADRDSGSLIVCCSFFLFVHGPVTNINIQIAIE